MTDAPTPRKRAKAPAPEGMSRLRDWQASSDGLTVSRNFVLASAEEAAKIAKRALSAGIKAGKRIDVGVDGHKVSVAFAAAAGAVDEEVRKIARGIRRKALPGEDRKAAKAAKGKGGKAKPAAKD